MDIRTSKLQTSRLTLPSPLGSLWKLAWRDCRYVKLNTSVDIRDVCAQNVPYVLSFFHADEYPVPNHTPNLFSPWPSSCLLTFDQVRDV